MASHSVTAPRPAPGSVPEQAPALALEPAAGAFSGGPPLARATSPAAASSSMPSASSTQTLLAAHTPTACAAMSTAHIFSPQSRAAAAVPSGSCCASPIPAAVVGSAVPMASARGVPHYRSAAASPLLMPPTMLNSRAYSSPGSAGPAADGGGSISHASLSGTLPTTPSGTAPNGSASSARSSGAAAALYPSSTSSSSRRFFSAAALRAKNLPLVLHSLPELVSVQSLRQTALSSLQHTADMFDSLLANHAARASSASAATIAASAAAASAKPAQPAPHHAAHVHFHSTAQPHSHAHVRTLSSSLNVALSPPSSSPNGTPTVGSLSARQPAKSPTLSAMPVGPASTSHAATLVSSTAVIAVPGGAPQPARSPFAPASSPASARCSPVAAGSPVISYAVAAGAPPLSRKGSGTRRAQYKHGLPPLSRVLSGTSLNALAHSGGPAGGGAQRDASAVTSPASASSTSSSSSGLSSLANNNPQSSPSTGSSVGGAGDALSPASVTSPARMASPEPSPVAAQHPVDGHGHRRTPSTVVVITSPTSTNSSVFSPPMSSGSTTGSNQDHLASFLHQLPSLAVSPSVPQPPQPPQRQPTPPALPPQSLAAPSSGPPSRGSSGGRQQHSHTLSMPVMDAVTIAALGELIQRSNPSSPERLPLPSPSQQQQQVSPMATMEQQQQQLHAASVEQSRAIVLATAEQDLQRNTPGSTASGVSSSAASANAKKSGLSITLGSPLNGPPPTSSSSSSSSSALSSSSSSTSSSTFPSASSSSSTVSLPSGPLSSTSTASTPVLHSASSTPDAQRAAVVAAAASGQHPVCSPGMIALFAQDSVRSHKSSVSSTRSLVRSPGSSPPPVEKPAWALRLTKTLVCGDEESPSAALHNLHSVRSNGSNGGGYPSHRLSLDSTSSVTSTGSGHGHRPAGGMALSLPMGDMVLDRAQSYVVREHTVLVGAYRINQSGLYTAGGPPSTISVTSSHASNVFSQSGGGVGGGDEQYGDEAEDGDSSDDEVDGNGDEEREEEHYEPEVDENGVPLASESDGEQSDGDSNEQETEGDAEQLHQQLLSPTPSELAALEDEARRHEAAVFSAQGHQSRSPDHLRQSHLLALSSPHALLDPVDEAGEGPGSASFVSSSVTFPVHQRHHRVRSTMSSSSTTTMTGQQQQQQPVSNGDSRSTFARKRAKLKRRSTSTMPAALSSHANTNRSSRPSSSHHSGHTASSGNASGGRRHSRASHSVGGSSGGRRRGSSQPQEMCLSKEDLVELEVIGRGQNGLVRKAVHLPTLTRVALKSMDVYEKSTRHQLLHELHAYSGLNSPYLISFLGAYHDSGRIFLASEYMDCGSLSHLIHRCGGRLRDEALIKHVAAQCLAGLAYLHASHRIHRDIKPDNLLLHHSGSVKVGDFGLMVSVDPSNPCTSEFLGTLAYLSPERLQSCDYSFGADIWSLGVSLILAATGQLPVVGADFWEFISAMERNPPSLANTIATMRAGGYDKSNKAQQDGQGKKSDNVAASLGEHEIPPATGDDSNGGAAAVPDDSSFEFSAAFHDFIDCMLVMDPLHRWSAEQLLSHPFLADVTDTSVSHAYAWQHEHVAQQNERDLDVILDLLANRQITKLADAEHRRMRARSGEDPNVGAPIPSHARTPGHAVTQPSFAYPPAVAAAASAAASANVNAKANPTADAAALPPLQVSVSPHLRVGGDGGTMGSHPSLSSSSSSSSTLSRSPGDGGPASTTSDTSSLGSTASLDMMLSAECCGLTLSLQQSSSPATNLHSAGSNISADSMFSPSTCSSASSTSHASSSSSLNVFGVSSGGISTPYPPTPLSASASASLFGSPPPVSVGGGHGSFLSPSPEPPLSYGSATFVLPAAPTMGMDANSNADPVVTLPSPPSMLPAAPNEMSSAVTVQTGGANSAASQADSVMASLGATMQRRMSVPSTGVAAFGPTGSESGCLCGGASGVDTVEILAVVSQLDAARLAVLSQQYSLPCDEIQARFAQTQLSLFDQLEEAAATAQLVPPQGEDGTTSTQDGTLSDHKVSFPGEKGEALLAPMSPTQPQTQGTGCCA